MCVCQMLGCLLLYFQINISNGIYCTILNGINYEQTSMNFSFPEEGIRPKFVFSYDATHIQGIVLFWCQDKVEPILKRNNTKHMSYIIYTPSIYVEIILVK